MEYDTERTPWEQVQGRGQVAGETERVEYGGESPWYVGARYVADATLAAKARRVEEAKQRDAADRRARYLARTGRA